MARIRDSALLSTLLAAVLLGASGCSAFFSFNAFSSLDKPGVPDPSRYTGASGLANLQADLSSAAVVNALKGSPSTVTTILGDLESSYSVHSGSLSSPTDKTAAVLYADLALQGTSGDELVNNVVTTIVNTPQNGNIASLIKSVVPSDVSSDPAKFSAMVLGLYDANQVYLNLGSHLPPAPPGVNMGDVAQKAAVAFLMDAILTAVEGQVPTNQSGAITQMFDLVNGQANSLGTVTLSDPFSPLNANLKAIFDAAGAPYPA